MMAVVRIEIGEYLYPSVQDNQRTCNGICIHAQHETLASVITFQYETTMEMKRDRGGWEEKTREEEPWLFFSFSFHITKDFKSNSKANETYNEKKRKRRTMGVYFFNFFYITIDFKSNNT